MNRKRLQALAKTRLKDAKVLLGRKRWGAAYYLTGYVVECALKSCVLRHLDATGLIFVEKGYLKKLYDELWTHDLVKLVNLAGLDREFGEAHRLNPDLKANWGLVAGWKEISRYEEKTEIEAKALYAAVSDNPNGVLWWLQTRW